jgi:GT2 family glycosyltransferase
MIEVSVIIVTYQSENEIQSCLESIIEYTMNVKYEIIVIDNASIDNTLHVIKQNFPRVICLQNKRNRGFSTANNQAASICKGKHLFFINPDAVLVDNSIEILLSFYKKVQNIGILGPEIINSDGTLQSSTGYLPSISTTLYEIFGLYLIFPNSYFGYRFIPDRRKEQMSVGWVSGACFLVSKKYYAKINGFDKNYFMYMEDVDLCRRIQLLKKKIVYTTSTKVVHMKAQSSKQNRYPANIANYYSKLYYHKKFDGKVVFYVLVPILLIASVIKLFALIILMKSKDKIHSQYRVIKSLVKINNSSLNK